MASKLNFIGAGVTAAINGGDPTQLDVTIPGAAASPLTFIEDVPTDLRYCGDKSGGTYVSSGPLTLDGEWHFTSFNLQAAHTITVGAAGFLVIRVCGPCTIDGTINADGKGASHFVQSQSAVGHSENYFADEAYVTSANTVYARGVGTGGGSGGGMTIVGSPATITGMFLFGSPSRFMDRDIAIGGACGAVGGYGALAVDGTTPATQYRKAIMSIGHRALGATGGGRSTSATEGHGGGYVLVVADALTFTGSILARGGAALSSTGGGDTAPGGGGGGVVILSAKTYPLNTGILDVSGGLVSDDAGLGASVGGPPVVTGNGGAGWTHTQIIP